RSCRRRGRRARGNRPHRGAVPVPGGASACCARTLLGGARGGLAARGACQYGRMVVCGLAFASSRGSSRHAVCRAACGGTLGGGRERDSPGECWSHAHTAEQRRLLTEILEGEGAVAHAH